MIITSILLILVISICLIGIYYVTKYNNLVTYKLKIEKAENIIDISLRNKYDLIVKMNILIKKIVTKKDYLKEYTELKNKNISNYELDRKLTEAENIIQEVIYDYSELETKEFKNYLKEINKVNEKLISSKNYYNENITDLNKIIRKFPTSIIAKLHNFYIKPFFDGKNMQDNIIDDFKL